ncbi:hypothetical protein JYT87_01890 [Nitrospira defluvii]|nr:hypothetical protein [Nitrospira defluvii]
MKKFSKQLGVGIFLVAFFTMGIASAVDLHRGEKIQLLSDRFNQNLQEEALRIEEQRAAYRVLARPYSEYLLFQKDFNSQSYTADLGRIRQERKTILQKLAMLGDGSLQETKSGMPDSMPAEAFPVYSGAPMLSFYYGGQFDAEPILDPSGVWMDIVVFMAAGLLLLIFPFSLVVLYKEVSEFYERKNVVTVFPIFTFRARPLGPRELLKMTVYKGEPA